MRNYFAGAGVALFAATNVLAADLPRRAVPLEAPSTLPAFTWTGFYVGGNIGGGTQRDNATVRSADPTGVFDDDFLNGLNLARTHFDGSGFVGGAQVGYNYQFTPGAGFVVGAEADVQFADVKKSKSWSDAVTTVDATSILTVQTGSSTRSSLDFLGTVRGRLGYAFDRVLIYGTGGLAYGDAGYRYNGDVAYNFVDSGAALIAGVDRYGAKYNGVRTGYAYGGGVEYALPLEGLLKLPPSTVVTLGGEYLHYDLGTKTVSGYTMSGGGTRSGKLE